MAHPNVSSTTTTNSIKHHRSGISSNHPWTEDLGPSEVAHSLPHHHHGYNEVRQRELEEARARAAQMEKTMRWWSDCTANWREKWSKVRTERNKIREEARMLRSKLEIISKDNSTLKREKQELEAELERFKAKSPSYVQTPKKECKSNKQEAADKASSPLCSSPVNLSIQSPHEDSIPSEVSQVIQAANEDLEFLDKLLQKNDVEEMDSTFNKEEMATKSMDEQSLISQKMCFLQYKLEEALKAVETEKLNKSLLHKRIEVLEKDLENKPDKPDHSLKNSLNKVTEEESPNLEDKVTELRMQLEKLQEENAAEWGRCEKLETEKLSLERENKKLRSHIQDIEDRLERKTKQMAVSGQHADVKSLQLDLYEKNKELSELKQAHSKLKKILQDKSTELNHALRRAEQYEVEVKKLRGRIEELKKELINVEDEVDNSTNTIRKLQRSNEELQDQMEQLQISLKAASPTSVPIENDLNNLSGIPEL